MVYATNDSLGLSLTQTALCSGGLY